MGKNLIQGTLFPELEVKENKEPQCKVKRESIKALQQKIAALEAEKQALISENESLKDKAQAFDELSKSQSLFTMTTIAHTYGKSAIWLNKYLEQRGVQYHNGEVWVLYAQYKGKGYAKTVYFKYGESNTGKARENPHTYWTGAGLSFIHSLLKKDGLI